MKFRNQEINSLSHIIIQMTSVAKSHNYRNSLEQPLMTEFFTTLRESVSYAKEGRSEEAQRSTDQLKSYNLKLRLPGVARIRSSIMRTAKGGTSYIFDEICNVVESHEPSKAMKALGFFRLYTVPAHDIDLDGYLRTYSRDGQVDPSFYHLRYASRNSYNVGFVFDAKHALELVKEGKPIACIGFDLEDMSMQVKQIQGARNKQEDLSHFRWERMLLKIVTDFASSCGFRQVRVQRAEDNKWWKKTDQTEPVGLNNRLKMKYDVTARRNGFRFDEELKCYVLDLETS